MISIGVNRFISRKANYKYHIQSWVRHLWAPLDTITGNKTENTSTPSIDNGSGQVLHGSLRVLCSWFLFKVANKKMCVPYFFLSLLFSSLLRVFLRVQILPRMKSNCTLSRVSVLAVYIVMNT